MVRTTAFNCALSLSQFLECFHAQRGDLSLLMPRQFGEVLLRVYTKDVRFVHHLIVCLDVLLADTSGSLVLSRQVTAL